MPGFSQNKDLINYTTKKYKHEKVLKIASLSGLHGTVRYWLWL